MRFVRGFTLVELIVVVAVVGIIATLGVISFGRIQADGRNHQRDVSVSIIAEALEKYYDDNGEYPVCSVLQGSAESIKTVLGLDMMTLKAPQSSTTNSIICEPLSTNDAFAYIGDGSAQCTSGSACLSFTLQYREEITDAIKSLKSRRVAVVVDASTPEPTTMTASIEGAIARGDTSPAICRYGAPQYRINVRMSGGAWNNGSWGTAISRTTAAAQGNQYEYRAEARCVLPDGSAGVVVLSNIDAAVAPINAPSAPVLAVSGANSGTNDTTAFTWNAVSCPAGATVQYQTVNYRDDATGWRTSWASTTGQSRSLPTDVQGYEYRLKGQARCASAYTTGPYSPDSNAPSYVRNVDAPGGVSGIVFTRTTSNNPSGGGTYQTLLAHWNQPECGPGTVKRFQMPRAYIWSTANPPQNGIPGGSFVDSIFVIASSTPNFEQQLNKWQTAGVNELRTEYRTTTGASSPVNAANGGGATGWYDWDISSTDKAFVAYSGSYAPYTTVMTGARIYVRYACLNTVTDRYAIGQPVLNGWTGW